jgi:hypothetical protein
VVLADSELKLGNDGFADLELKLGIDLFAGKSEITEGCSDLREIGDSSDLPGISDVRLSRCYGSDAAGAAVRRKAVLRYLVLRNFGAAVVDRRAVAFGLHPCRFSSGPRAHRSYGQRFCDLATAKQTAAMAAAICGAKLSEAQCFRGFAAESWRDVAHGEQRN